MEQVKLTRQQRRALERRNMKKSKISENKLFEYYHYLMMELGFTTENGPRVNTYADPTSNSRGSLRIGDVDEATLYLNLSNLKTIEEFLNTALHELTHLKQAQSFKTFADYKVAYEEEANKGYYNNKFEIEAHEAGDGGANAMYKKLTEVIKNQN